MAPREPLDLGRRSRADGTAGVSAHPSGCRSRCHALADPARLAEMATTKQCARRSRTQRQLAAEGGPEVAGWVILRDIKRGQQVA